MQTLDLGAKTDRGKRRQDNQDALLVRSRKSAGNGGPVHLLVVADGMGGAAGGEVASRETVKVLDDAFARAGEADPTSFLRQAFADANARVRGTARERPSLEGMATTLVATMVRGGQLWVANVGDSRAYLIRDGEIRQLTEDHSWVGEQVKAGLMSREEAASSPQRNIITRCVGADASVDVDAFGPFGLQAGDLVVLCSDGLYGVVSDAEIAATASKAAPAAAAEQLVSLANTRGGPDNISVVVCRVQGQGAETATFAMVGRKALPRLLLIILGIVAGLVVTGGIIGGVILANGGGGDDQSGLLPGPSGRTDESVTPTPAHRSLAPTPAQSGDVGESPQATQGMDSTPAATGATNRPPLEPTTKTQAATSSPISTPSFTPTVDPTGAPTETAEPTTTAARTATMAPTETPTVKPSPS